MERVTITIDDELLQMVDALMQRRGYASRSEAVRDMIRAAAARETVTQGKTLCMAVLAYIFDYETRGLAQILSRALHDHHDLVVSTVRVPIDHESALEVSVLEGKLADVRALADAITVERGVRHASLHVVPVSESGTRHDHGPGTAPHAHIRA
ncbi:MAG TPA: nickel-responsive transcriptional regulator NikR [Acetobacteraceae bacterium]|jgi:CopG family nickel-responsive transcriptional regulator|nr:nickel-responsive transcriptional regulator NikR [Acetobacteraceae bacterium]